MRHNASLWSRIALDNGLAPNRRQAIFWTNGATIHSRIYAALGGDVLININHVKRHCFHAIWYEYAWFIKIDRFRSLSSFHSSYLQCQIWWVDKVRCLANDVIRYENGLSGIWMITRRFLVPWWIHSIRKFDKIDLNLKICMLSSYLQ